MSLSKLKQQIRRYPLGALVSQSTFAYPLSDPRSRNYEKGLVIDHKQSEDDDGIWLVVLSDNKVKQWRLHGNAVTVLQKPYTKIKF